MAWADLKHREKAQGACEFALSSHQLISASHPRASIRAVIVPKPEQLASSNN